MRSALAVIGLLASPAAAELRAGLHMGGGLEGGLISGEPRPDAVGEAGLTIQALLPDRNWGFGLSIESVGRLTSQFDASEELKLDATVRWATPDRRVRWGIGAGYRLLTLDEPGRQTIRGLDLMRVDIDIDAARWDVGDATISVGVHVAWTFGCYRDSYAPMPVGDVKSEMRDIDCTDTISTTYVVGLATSVRWR